MAVYLMDTGEIHAKMGDAIADARRREAAGEEPLITIVYPTGRTATLSHARRPQPERLATSHWA